MATGPAGADISGLPALSIRRAASTVGVPYLAVGATVLEPSRAAAAGRDRLQPRRDGGHHRQRHGRTDNPGGGRRLLRRRPDRARRARLPRAAGPG